jgi:RimJ/RimL family protein N-acetyltransferase
VAHSALALRALTEDDLPTLTAWFQDTETRRRLGGMFPVPEWFGRVRHAEDKLLQVAVVGGQPVAYVDVDLESDGSASLGLLVAPGMRGQGLGRQVLEQTVQMLADRGVLRVSGEIEADNVASTRCFQAAGFGEGAHGEFGVTYAIG